MLEKTIRQLLKDQFRSKKVSDKREQLSPNLSQTGEIQTINLRDCLFRRKNLLRL